MHDDYDDDKYEDYGDNNHQYDADDNHVKTDYLNLSHSRHHWLIDPLSGKWCCHQIIMTSIHPFIIKSSHYLLKINHDIIL